MVQHSKIWGPYRFLSDQALTNGDTEVLSRAMARPSCTGAERLAGRGEVAHIELEGPQRVILKAYCRGGILCHVVKRRYLRWGKRRCQAEYEMLRRVRALGVNAPEPIAYAFQGSLVYRAWLITKEIYRPERLSDLSSRDELSSRGFVANVTRQVTLLINHKIQHVDLHPGNILIDGSGNAFLIDFDKARFFHGSTSRLCHRYIRRWDRAVVKHCLPEMLAEEFSAGLARQFDLG